MEVRIYTFGRQTLSTIPPFDQMPEVQRMPMEGVFYGDISGRALKAVINSDYVPLVFNCRMFWEKPKNLRTSPSWGHSGVHSANIKRLLAHSWGDTMKEFAENFHSEVNKLRASRHSLKCLDIGLECNQGRDRSVGMSVVLHNIFHRGGFKVTTTHLCKTKWRPNNACKRAAQIMTSARNPGGPCPECKMAYSYEMTREEAKSVAGFASLLSELNK
jgi:hypothetical protein